MFWRREQQDAMNRKKKKKKKERISADNGEDEGGDELARLQRQFGITPVQDRDVEAEFLQLLGAAQRGGRGTEEHADTDPDWGLLGGPAGNDVDEEEAQILRELNISGKLDAVDVDALSGEDEGGDDMSDSEGDRAAAQVARRELRGVLEGVHRTAKQRHDEVNHGACPDEKESASEVATPERVHALKLQALALKREGRVQEALAVFRQLKALEAQLPADRSLVVATAEVPQTPQPSNGHSVGKEEVDAEVEMEVEVTDDDMENPEYLAQLALLGLPVEGKPVCAQPKQDEVESIEDLERRIADTKMRAIQFKREGRITEALAEMRTIKELTGRLEKRQGNPIVSGLNSTNTNAPHTGLPTQRDAKIESASPMGKTGDEAPNTREERDSDVDPYVEVTDEDMADPAFDDELRGLLGGDPVLRSAPPDDSDFTLETPEAVEEPTRLQVSCRYRLSNTSSIDDDDLIDAFDDDDSEPDKDSSSSTGHLNTVANSDGMHASTCESARVEVTATSTSHPLMHEDGGEREEQSPPLPCIETDAPSAGTDVSELQIQLERAKVSAIRLKRGGDVQGALAMMRRIKQIEHLIEMKRGANHQHGLGASSSPTSSASSYNGTNTYRSTHNVDQARLEKFRELETLLVEFRDRATEQTREHLSVDRARAAEWLAKRKQYAAELDRMREKRAIPGQFPPSFQVESVTESVKVERTNIPEDEAHFEVHSVNGLQQVAGRSIFVKFNLSFPSSNPHEGTTGVVRISETEPFTTDMMSNQNRFRFKLQRSRGTQRLFEIKKLVVEVWRPGSLLRSPELVARGYQELAPLLSAGEIECHVPFVGPNRKPVGGDVKISLQIRVPLRDIECKTIETKVLHIGEYPQPVQPPPPASPSSTTTDVATAPTPRSLFQPATREPNSDPSAGMVQGLDNDDPHDLDLIVSYDVINEEMEKISEKLVSITGSEAAELSDRYDSLALKKQLLEIEMQTGKLTLDMYVERLHARISEDRQLVAQLARANRRPDAARVLRRVRIMEKELEGAGRSEE